MSRLERRYRPKVLDDVIFSDAAQRIRLASKIAPGRSTPPHTILVGQPGNGKSVLAKLLADGFALDPAWVIIIHGNQASPSATIASLEEKTRDNPPPLFGDRGAVVIDEVDELSIKLQDQLRCTMDNAGDNWWFIATANNEENIEPRLKDRCVIECFSLQNEDIKARLKEIARSEGKVISDQIIQKIVRLADGSIRKAVNMLDEKLV